MTKFVFHKKVKLLKTLFLTVILFCIACCNNINAASVAQQNAQTIALNFYKVNTPTGTNGPGASLNYIRKEDDGTVDFYVFNILPGPGFVIVSGDDNFTPILGYSFQNNFDATIMKTGLVNWMYSTSVKIYGGIQNQVVADATIKSQWAAYAQGMNPNVSRSGSSVGPLLATTWNQEPYYNALCPYNSTDQQQCVTGCVATAMAQIMKFWSYPTVGVGTYSYNDAPPNYSSNYGVQSAQFDTTHYNWTGMPNALYNSNSNIALLMYQCGVSVAMDYGDDNQGGSGAYVMESEVGPGQPCAELSYTKYFSYDPNTIQGVEQANYSTSDWIALLESELTSGRPVQYEGTDPSAGGHTWVCDGFDVNDNMHMNWGWGGSSNGYYNVTDLAPTGTNYTFSSHDGALIGIEPLDAPFQVVASADDQVLCAGGSTVVAALGPINATYSWTPSTGLICANCSATTATPKSTTTYLVTVDSAGIKGRASVTIVVPQTVSSSFTVVNPPICSLPANVTFSNTAVNATGYQWDFGDGVTSTAQSPVHAYNNYDTYTVSLIAYNQCGQDTFSQPNVQIVDPSPVAEGKNSCKGQSVTLSATNSGSISWYDNATNGNLLGTGSTYTTPDIYTNTTYYAATSNTVSSPIITGGAPDNTMGQGGYFTNANTGHSLIFNCSVAQTLVSVVVYAKNSGNRTISILDSNDVALSSVTVDIPAGQQTVTLNLAIPVGNNLKLYTGGGPYLYRNSSGAVYPYTSGDGSVVITNSDAGVVGYYYYFYNWKLQKPGCVPARTPVLVNVSSLSSSIQTSVTGTEVSFEPVNTSATSFLWNFADDNTSTSETPTHTYKTSGKYDVLLVESNGTCTDTISYDVDIAATGISNSPFISSWNLYPDPASDIVHLQISSPNDMDDCKLSVYNILGEKVFGESINLANGSNSQQVNVSNLAAGVYLITLQSGQYTTTKRFTKAGN